METYDLIYNYERYSRYPYPDSFDKEQKRELRRKASKYTLEDEMLYWKGRRWIINEEQKDRIFQSCHADQLSGHFVRDKTREKIWSRFFWSGIYDEVTNRIASCDTCQRAQKHFNKKHSELHSIPVKPVVWSRIGIDLIGPLTERPRGNRYIIICSDYFSTWPEADALKSKDADGVAMFLYKLITRHGVAEIVMR